MEDAGFVTLRWQGNGHRLKPQNLLKEFGPLLLIDGSHITIFLF